MLFSNLTPFSKTPIDNPTKIYTGENSNKLEKNIGSIDDTKNKA
jgi:hypothetical protein